jgi:hypothetical protein
MEETQEFKDVNEYIERLKGLSTWGVIEHEDIHLAFVKTNGWDVEPLKEYLKAAKEDHKTAEEEKEKIRVKDAKEKADKIYEEIKIEKDPTKIKEKLESIQELFLSASSAELKSCSWEDYINDINKYDTEKEFRPKLFTVKDADKIEFSLPFPLQTLSAVGARTGRGKTIMLVNLALDAIENGRKCIFISLEMTRRQLLNKLILLRTYSQVVASNNETNLNTLKTLPNPHSSLYKFLNNKTEENTGNKYNGAQNDAINFMFEEAKTFIQEKMEKGEFELVEAFWAEQDQIICKVSQADKGTLVLIDYAQRMPEKVGETYDGGHLRMKKINKALFNATVKSEVITICAAQFNRLSGQDDGADKFDDTSFKESGSIEEDAHNAIGIGLEKDKKSKKSRFCEILKARDSGGTGMQFSLEFNGAYSYMENIGKRGNSNDDPEEEKNHNGKDRAKQKKKISTMNNWD